MSTKEALIEMIREMPDDATSVEYLAYELYVRAKIEEGIRQADAGDVIDHEEFKRRMARWLA
jgi:predicted transcriptional regulator